MLGYISFIISVVGALPYLWLVVKGRVRPERATWGIWTLILVLSVMAYKSQGAGDSLWFLVGDLTITGAIFAASLWRGKGGHDRLDVVCVLIAVAGLLLWLVTSNPLMQLVGVMLADMVAIVPTVRKTLEQPFEESATTFGASSVAALLGVLSVDTWDTILIAYPLYLYTANLITAIVIVTAQKVARKEIR